MRSFSEIIALKKQWKPSQSWIFHGFDKNLQTAETLLKEGCLFSFGKAIFNERSHAAAVLSQMPTGQFFLETDDATLPIEDVYQKTAELRRVSLELLSALMEENFQAVFQIS